ncbi:MAG: methionine gamma-lyase family protein [Candidatus Eremiobacteraeota bacterium]|nr:methionine gamma-lyase family protein [Candidatus Eremiobacteraeota bacterium]
MIERLCERFGIDGPVRDAAIRAESRVAGLTYPAQIETKCTVMEAFLAEGIAESDFAGTSGYGYDDAAREHYESLLARIFGTERVLARLSLVSGTHAIVTALAACMDPGKTLLSVTGRPYDTLRNAIVDAPYSLVKQGITYEEVALSPAGGIDLDAVARALENRSVTAIFVQRSRGYATRPSVNVDAIACLCALVKGMRSDVRVLVDNCYGELVEAREPSHVGADLIMGSLIKNLGGSIAPAGAYIAGSLELIERVAARHYAPGLGDALGPTLGLGRLFFQGLFLAPMVVEQALRTQDFAAALFAELGYAVDPQPGAPRTDIVQAIRLGSAASIARFARGLQTGLPVNARFAPEAGSVPGYADAVMMSGGAFVAGATIELSCDAPMREPFEVYLQGGVSYEQGALAILFAAKAVGAKASR